MTGAMQIAPRGISARTASLAIRRASGALPSAPAPAPPMKAIPSVPATRTTRDATTAQPARRLFLPAELPLALPRAHARDDDPEPRLPELPPRPRVLAVLVAVLREDDEGLFHGKQYITIRAGSGKREAGSGRRKAERSFRLPARQCRFRRFPSLSISCLLIS